MFLLDDILLSPLKGIVWLGREIDGVYRREMSDESGVKEKLLALQFRFELDEITRSQYNEQEKELLDKLEEMRKMKEEGE